MLDDGTADLLKQMRGRRNARVGGDERGRSRLKRARRVTFFIFETNGGLCSIGDGLRNEVNIASGTGV